METGIGVLEQRKPDDVFDGTIDVKGERRETGRFTLLKDTYTSFHDEYGQPEGVILQGLDPKLYYRKTTFCREVPLIIRPLHRMKCDGKRVSEGQGKKQAVPVYSGGGLCIFCTFLCRRVQRTPQGKQVPYAIIHNRNHHSTPFVDGKAAQKRAG